MCEPAFCVAACEMMPDVGPDVCATPKTLVKKCVSMQQHQKRISPYVYITAPSNFLSQIADPRLRQMQDSSVMMGQSNRTSTFQALKPVSKCSSDTFKASKAVTKHHCPIFWSLLSSFRSTLKIPIVRSSLSVATLECVRSLRCCRRCTSLQWHTGN
jgi:hypothetical protein